MLTIIIRSVIIYILVLVLFRVMGKRQLGQMQPFEFVLTLIIADLATIPMAEISVPVLHGIIPLFTLVLLHFVLTTLSKISLRFGSFISGKPVIVINPQGIDYKSLKSLNLSIDDLFEAIREQGFFSLDQIEFAIMETNGKMSILPKAQNAPLTPSDMGVETKQTYIPVSLVVEGKILRENVEYAGVNEGFVKDFVSSKIKNGKIKNVLIMTLDKSGKVVLQMTNSPQRVFENAVEVKG